MNEMESELCIATQLVRDPKSGILYITVTPDEAWCLREVAKISVSWLPRDAAYDWGGVTPESLAGDEFELTFDERCLLDREFLETEEARRYAAEEHALIVRRRRSGDRQYVARCLISGYEAAKQKAIDMRKEKIAAKRAAAGA